MKKSLCILTLLTMLMSMILGGYAGATGKQVFEKEGILYDLRPTEEKSTTGERVVSKDKRATTNIEGSTDGDTSLLSLEDGEYTATSKIEGDKNAYGDKIKATATSSATRIIDYIYAKARVFEDGGVIGSGEDEATNSSYAGATTGFVDFGFATWDNDARGNHLYKDEGWKDIVHETYTSSF